MTRIKISYAFIIIVLNLIIAFSAIAASWTKTGNLSIARNHHSTIMLSDGRILVSGGMSQYMDAPSVYQNSSEIYDPATGEWSITGDLNYARSGHTSILLLDGKVLVAGGSNGSGNLASSEIYDPITGTWTATGDLAYSRTAHTMTLLPDGKVLVAGGAETTSEIYDPSTGIWALTGELGTTHENHTATLLPDGKVLVAGGENDGSNYLSYSEIYNPTTGNWTATGDLNIPRRDHTATLLPDGTVLVAGGEDGSGELTISEIYNPATGNWTTTGDLNTTRYDHTSTLLPDGRVLVAGGAYIGYTHNYAEIYDPVEGNWTATEDLNTRREDHTATLLPDGTVLLTGGYDYVFLSLASTEIYDPVSTGSWTTKGDLNAARSGHTATLLTNGTILVAGGYGNSNYLSSCEIYNPASENWTMTGDLNFARSNHTATLLLDGTILVAGGINDTTTPGCEIYDPATGNWTLTGSTVGGGENHTATLLPDGTVFAAGGFSITGTSSYYSQIYDPTTGIWTVTDLLIIGRGGHTATLLPDGTVLVAGGILNTWTGPAGTLDSTLIYNPATGNWTTTGDLNTPRSGHTATLLPNGKVLVACDSSSEIYNPATGKWSPTGDLNNTRSGHTATLLQNGKVLVTGGGTTVSEIYDPASETWTVTGNLNTARSGHTTTLLSDGRVLAAGGGNNSAEIFDIGLSFDPAWRPLLNPIASPLYVGHTLEVTGSGLRGASEASGGNGHQNSPTNFPLLQLCRVDNGQLHWLEYDPSANISDTEFTSIPVLDFPDGHVLATVFANGIPSESEIILIANPPWIRSIVRANPSPTNSGSVDFLVTFSENVNGVDADDFALSETGPLSGSAISNVTGSLDTYTVTVSGYAGDGTLRLDIIDDDSIEDPMGFKLGGLGMNNGNYTDGEIYEIDMISPNLASTSVWFDGRSVDVTFSEEMGSGVISPSSYVLSGPGKGTLSDNPDTVEYQYDNLYRLIWNPGEPYMRNEMCDGENVTITVSNVHDAVGNPIGTPNSNTDYEGGIGFAPETAALPSGNIYTDTVEVELICDDGENGSGCAAIYYTVNGEDPTTSSPQYSDLINIDEFTELKFMAVDNAGNAEGINSQVYYIEKSTTISCNLSTDNIIFGEGFTVFGSIGNGPPNDPDQGISIELIPPVGDSILFSTNADVNGGFSKDVVCDVITSASVWNVRTSWPGDASHLAAGSVPTPLTVSQATTTLTLDVVSSEAIKVNSQPPIGGDFSSLPHCGDMDLSGTAITIYASEPDGGDIHTLSAFTNTYGQFLLDYDTAEGGQPFDFDVVGEWVLSAEYTETNEFSGATTDDVIIRVVPTAGYAILVQGLVQSGEGAASHRKTASFVYDTLKDRQILDDDIQYLSWNIDDDWDGFPYKSSIQDAVTVWARDKMDPDFVHPIPELDTQGQAGDLTIILIDHGWTDPQEDEEGLFYIYPDVPLTSTELGAWVSELQANLAGTVSADRNIVVVLGFCRAGAFIADLHDESFGNRVVIASAAKDEASHRGPQDVDENREPLRDGEYFVSEFFKSVSYGKSIKQCFEEAVLLTETFTSSGTGEINAPYYDDSIQHPLLNDNNDALGSNVLSSEEGADGSASEYLFIGASPPEGNDPGDVLITKASPAQFMGFSDSTVDLWAEVDNPEDLRLIWLEVKAPDYNPTDPGAGFQIEMDTFKKATTDVAGSRYLWSAVGGGSDPTDLFDMSGTYQVFYFAKDNDTGHVSPLMQSRVYKAMEGNSPPSEFDLLTPDNDASVLTTVILDWEDAIDPDEDSLTYTILLSEDDDQFADPMFIEGLSDSAYLLSPDDGIEDLTTYYWKVQAIDAYGALRESSVRVFHTDNTNPVINGYIKGYVYDTISSRFIHNASVTVGTTSLNSALNGHFIGGMPPGTYPVTVTALGYQTLYPGSVTISEGQFLTRNFALQPESVDTDGDGLPDDLEDAGCTDTHDADTDDDGIMDGDEDSDHDGIVDPGETDPCDIDTDNDGIQDGTESGLATGVTGTDVGTFQPDLDPLSQTDPLDTDTDSDGQNDGEEDLNFNGRVDPGESDPNDPNSKRMKLMPWIPLLLE